MSDQGVRSVPGPRIALVSPIPPMPTGLSTFALRILDGARDLADWTVAYPEGGDPGSLPKGIRSLPLENLDPDGMDGLIYNIGNSMECFDVVQTLQRFGGTAVLHETVLHHMLRLGYMERGMLLRYRSELACEYGPGAGHVEKRLSRPKGEAEYDAMLKAYPLTARTILSCTSVACLNTYSLSRVSQAMPPDRAMLISHPLSPLSSLPSFEKPFPFTVGMVGGYHPGRNLGTVIEAVGRLRELHPDTGLLLAGGGYPVDTPDWTVAKGRLDEADYQGWIRTMDAVVDFRHPTCGETSGSLLEAMRAGITPVVSASDAFLYLPSDGVLRVPVETGAQGIAAALQLLRSDIGLRRRLGMASMDHAVSQGSRERLREDWDGLIRMCVGSSKDRPGPQRIGGRSLSAAWHPVPEGFMRDLSTGPVTWRFTGGAVLHGPASAAAATLTAWGEGTVNGEPLPLTPAAVSVVGRDLELIGEGWVTDVFWE